MCGKSAPSTQTNSQQSSAGTSYAAPNPQALQAYNDLLSRASGVASTPYQPYTGEITAPINQQQQAGIGNINNFAGFAQPFVEAGAPLMASAVPAANAGAMGAVNAGTGAVGTANAMGQAGLGSALAGGADAMGYAKNAVNAASPIGSSQINNYLNPYTQQVVDATTKQFANMNAMGQQNVLSGAAAQGALGGDRVGVAQGILGGQQMSAEAPVIAGLYSKGYDTATNTALTEQQAQTQANLNAANIGLGAGSLGATSALGAGNLGVGANLGAGNLNLGAGSLAANTGIAAGTGLGNLGALGQSTGLQGAGAQVGAGTLEQQTQQATDTANLQQYLTAQGFPYQQAQWLAGLQTGVGSQMGGVSGQQTQVAGSGTVTPPAPSFLGQAIGAGVAGAGLLAKRGGRIPGFASGGSPFDSSLYGYIPTGNLRPGSTIPQPPAAPGFKFPDQRVAQQPSFADNIKMGGLGAQGLGKLYNKFGPDASNITIPGITTDTAGMSGIGFGTGADLGADATGSLAAWSALPEAAADTGIAAAAPAAWSVLPEVAGVGAEAAGVGAAAGGFDLLAFLASLGPAALLLSKGGAVQRRRGGYVPTVAGFGTGGIILPRGYADGGDTFDDRWNALGSQSGVEPSAVWDQAPPTPSGVEPSAVWDQAPSVADRYAGLNANPTMAEAIGPGGMPTAGVVPLPTQRPQQTEIGEKYPVSQGSIGGIGLSSAKPDTTSRSVGDAYQIAEKFLKPRIAQVESGGERDPYAATTKAPKTGDIAYGKYQVMGANIPSWTKETLGRSLTPQEFLASPQAQEAVATAKLGQYVSKYGVDGATRAWFAGEGGMNNQHASDGFNTVAQYAQKVLGGDGDNAALPSGAALAQYKAPVPGGADMGNLHAGVDSPGGMNAPGLEPPTPKEASGILSKLGINMTPELRTGLLSAGLGMMASRSPYLGQSIGEGGLHGVAAYSAERQHQAELPKIAAATKNLIAEAELHALQAKKAGMEIAGTTPISPQHAAEMKFKEREQAFKESAPTTLQTMMGPVSVKRLPNGTYQDIITGDMYGDNGQKINTTGGQQSAVPEVPSTKTMMKALQEDKHGKEFLDSVPKMKRNELESIAFYEAPMSTASIRTGSREQLLGLVRQVNPNYNQNYYGAQGQAIKEFLAGGQNSPAGQITYANTAIGHAGTAYDALQRLKSMPGVLSAAQKSGMPFLSYAAARLQNAAVRGTPEGVALNDYITASTLYGAEVSRLYSGSQGSQEERDTVRAPLNPALSLPEIEGGLRTSVHMLGSRTGALEDRWKTALDAPGMKEYGTKKEFRDFPVLHQRSQDVIAKIGAGIGPTGSAQTAPILTTKEQFDVLPSGTEYIRNGNRYRKP